MNSCVEAEKYRENLINLTNNCNLSVCTAYYIAKDFLNDLLNTYQTVLLNEQSKEMEKTEKVSIGNTTQGEGVGVVEEQIDLNRKAEQ